MASPTLRDDSYGAMPARPQLARAGSSGVGQSLAPSATLRQSGSLRALFRATSTVGIAEPPKPAPPPLRKSRSQRERRVIGRETVPLLRRSVTTQQIPPLVRAMSSMLRLPREEEKFRCHICFDDDVPVSEAVTLSTCDHRYCKACFKSYLEIKIREGNVYPVCFHPVEGSDRKTCGVAVGTRQIDELVEPEVWKKFNLFRFNKEHEHARECPHCSFIQDCKGPESPSCVCEQCSKEFCFFHDIAHEGGTCADYELQNAESESINRAKIKEIAKPCPGCTRDVEKDGGCNHMKCVACQTSFCWLCGEIVEDEPMPSHYSATSESPCSGKQFDGDEQIELPWGVRVYAVIVGLLCYPFAFLCALLVTPMAWCTSSTDDSFADMFWFRHTIAMIWLALFVSLLVFIGAIVFELAFRLVLFVAMLPFVIIKNVAARVCCCWRSHSKQAAAEETADSDLEAGLCRDEGVSIKPHTQEEPVLAHAA